MSVRVGTSNKIKRSDKVFVEKPDILDELITDLTLRNFNTNQNDNNVYNDQQSTTRSISSAENHTKVLKEQQRLRYIHTESMIQQNIIKSLEINANKQEKLFPILLNNLDKAKSYLDIIDKDIDLHDETQKNKTRRQFEDWNTIVHGSIQKKISKTLNAIDPKDLNKRKNEDYEKFLNITNRKPAIFRDIIIESEYNPLEPNLKCIKAKTGYLKDPIHIDALKAASESAMLGDNHLNHNKQQHRHLCKDTLNVELWASGQIEATPYGTFARMMAKSNNRSTTADAATTSPNKSAVMGMSHIVFDHFNYPTGKAAIDKEMPKGKRIDPIVIYANPKKIFHKDVPGHFELELSQIKPPENYNYRD